MDRNTRFWLWVGAAGWGVAILGVLLPWAWMEPLLLNMGMETRSVDPQIQYWLRMASGSWTVIGFLFMMTALYPRRYANIVSLLAWGTLFEGVVLLTYGLMLARPPFPFWGDVAFCLVIGTGLLYSRSKQ